MDRNDKTIKRMFRKDLLLLGGFLAIVWATNSFIFIQAINIAEHETSWVLGIIFFAAITILSATVLNIASNLKQGEDETYGEELFYRGLTHSQRREQQ